MYDPNHSFVWFNSDRAFTLSYITLTSNYNYETVDELNLEFHTIITILETERCSVFTHLSQFKKSCMIKMIVSSFDCTELSNFVQWKAKSV